MKILAASIKFVSKTVKLFTFTFPLMLERLNLSHINSAIISRHRDFLFYFFSLHSPHHSTSSASKLAQSLAILLDFPGTASACL